MALCLYLCLEPIFVFLFLLFKVGAFDPLFYAHLHLYGLHFAPLLGLDYLY
jgi:hypothetical protein